MAAEPVYKLPCQSTVSPSGLMQFVAARLPVTVEMVPTGGDAIAGAESPRMLAIKAERIHIALFMVTSSGLVERAYSCTRGEAIF
jgi:hypothetical protein